MFLGDLTAHVCAGPLPVGSVIFLGLPLKELGVGSPSIKHHLPRRSLIGAARSTRAAD